jgi:uncharacterized protein with GYD domain
MLAGKTFTADPGDIRTQTLRAFTSVEMDKILANIP